MKNPELFHKTIGILVNAYLNNTLIHGDCSACAVGNIISGNLGAVSFESHLPTYLLGNGELISVPWLNFEDSSADKKLDIREVTGYTIGEISEIERAFESASYIGDRMHNGLMAVVDALSEIHKMDAVAKQEAKFLFVKA